MPSKIEKIAAQELYDTCGGLEVDDETPPPGAFRP